MADGGNDGTLPNDARSVIVRDAEAGTPRDCGDVWNQIVLGRLRVTDSFSTGDREYLVLVRDTPGLSAITGRSLEVLERVLLGDSQKLVSIELGMSVSTVAHVSKRTLLAIGVEALPSKAPPLLCMLVQSSRPDCPTPSIRGVEGELDGIGYLALSIPLQNSVLSDVLSPAERAVVTMRLEGHSLAEIAVQRRRSRRTVANQLSTAFRRLGVSGRSSLVKYFVLAPPPAIGNP